LRELNIMHSNFKRVTLSDSENTVAVSEGGFYVPTELVEDRLTGHKVNFILGGSSADGGVTSYRERIRLGARIEKIIYY